MGKAGQYGDEIGTSVPPGALPGPHENAPLLAGGPLSGGGYSGPNSTRAASFPAISPQPQYNTGDAEGYFWDLCLVIPAEVVHEHPPKLIQDLNNVGLETYQYFSLEKTHIICKIRTTILRLSEHAKKIGFFLLLDEHRLKDATEEGIRNPQEADYIVAPIHIHHDLNISPYKPHQFIYSKGPVDPRNEGRVLPLFAHADGLSHPFGAVHRIKLLLSIIKLDCGISLEQLVHEGQLSAFFPLKDETMANEISDKWLSLRVMPWQMPIDEIMRYFGEKIGMYFAFLGHFTTLMIPIAALGLLIFLVVLAESSGEGGMTAALSGSAATPLFCVLLALWAQTAIEYWKRRESTKAMEWGMLQLEEVIESDRPEFEGDIQPSVVDGKPCKHFSDRDRAIRYFYSFAALVASIAVVIACLPVLYVVRLILGSVITYIITAIVIQVLGDIFYKLAVFLTVRENNRTDSQYEHSFIAKLFIFQFFNNYSMLFYIAFVRTPIGDVCDPTYGCIGELGLALFVIFGIRLVLTSAEAVLVPMIEPTTRQWMRAIKKQFLKWYNEEFNRHDDRPETTEIAQNGAHEFVHKIEDDIRQEEQLERMAEEKKKLLEVMSKTEKEFNLPTYHHISSTIDDYCQMAVTFGYVTLFSAAFPLAPLLALLGYYTKVRVDGYRLLNEYKRPIPQSATGLGSWAAVFQILAAVSVITNAGILCFTVQGTPSNLASSFSSFIAIQYSLFAIIGLLNYFIPDVPQVVPIQLARQKLLVSKVINGIPDPKPVKKSYVPVSKPPLRDIREIEDQITNV